MFYCWISVSWLYGKGSISGSRLNHISTELKIGRKSMCYVCKSVHCIMTVVVFASFILSCFCLYVKMTIHPIQQINTHFLKTFWWKWIRTPTLSYTMEGVIYFLYLKHVKASNIGYTTAMHMTCYSSLLLLLLLLLLPPPPIDNSITVVISLSQLISNVINWCHIKHRRLPLHVSKLLYI